MNNLMFLGAKSCGKSTIMNSLHRLLSESGYRVFTLDKRDYTSIEMIGQSLCKYDCILIEGDELTDVKIADMVDASVVLVGDIERGGVFAVLYGMYALLNGQRVSGFLINKFRGDDAILMSGLKFLEEKTGVPFLGIIPHISDMDDFIEVFRGAVEPDVMSQILGVNL
ncbi:MAG: AAA family ATPase [Methanocellales archaeon]|nr:AAA family ATPase [Methanocellales archaeon]MDD3421311.1 AAA family ATPase [Methanocellales archaeon]MDD4898585.1 AAA family ATPase [Methanocellales archaeon]MDD5446934.1 AAA family ATPase [Methanocellales archaeon]